jgi:DsbC/DsbD-like thiol-disulfide interchange protein/cytochrome c biogenesis protein CcdA
MDRPRNRVAALFSAIVTTLAVAALVVGALFVAAPAASAQQHAHAKLYARADGDDVKAAVEIAIDPGWHIYHGPTAADMGPPDAVGTPTTVTPVGDGFTWSAPRFPKPMKEEQQFGATKTFIYEHVGTPVLWLRGKKGPGADLSKLQVTIDGLTCDASGCLPYGETVAVAGPGSDKLFAKFPADLVVAAAAAAAAPQAADGVESSAKPAAANGASAEEKHVHAKLFARADGDDVKAAVEITIDPGWHIYHGPGNRDVGPDDPPIGVPTRVTLVGDGFTWGATRYPAPTRVDDAALKTYAFEHTGTVVLWQRGKAKAGNDLAKLSAKIDGQVCDANGCIPVSESVQNLGRGDDALFAKFPGDLTADPPPPAASSNGALPAGGNGDEDLARLPLWQFLGLAVGWAIFSLLMPCTYPMIPITISYFTKQSAQRHRSSLPLSLCYGAGIVLSFIVIGVVFGRVIIPFAANPWTNLVIGVVFVVFALSLLGLFILQPPQFLLGAATAATKQGGYLGVFLMGMTLCVTSFTCTAPFVGNLLAVGANGGEMVRVILGMGTFGLVMAVPFVFLSLVPAKVKALPKSGEWLHSLKVTLGFIELAAAVKFLSNCDLVWSWHALSREIVLALWSGILLVAALYVWGVITLKEDVELRGEGNHGIGGGKLVSGLALFLFAFYFLIGAFGARLDSTTEALAPNYSKPFFTSDGVSSLGGTRSGGPVAQSGPIMDDWDAALAKAKVEHKILAINFTGDV